jgi:hypothetical protein
MEKTKHSQRKIERNLNRNSGLKLTNWHEFDLQFVLAGRRYLCLPRLEKYKNSKHVQRLNDYVADELRAKPIQREQELGCVIGRHARRNLKICRGDKNRSLSLGSNRDQTAAMIEAYHEFQRDDLIVVDHEGPGSILRVVEHLAVIQNAFGIPRRSSKQDIKGTQVTERPAPSHRLLSDNL